MSAAEFDHLLRDATRLAWYAARHGKLPEGSRIFFLIDAATRAGPNWSDHISDLCVEMNAIARAVGPVAASLLIRGGAITKLLQQLLITLAPFFLGFLTLLLTAYLAFQSQQLSQADTAIREYQEWISHDPREKLYSAWKMYRYEQVLNVKGPPLAQLDAYQKLVTEAKEASEKGNSVLNLLQQSSPLLVFPKILETHGPAFSRALVKSLNPPQYDAGTQSAQAARQNFLPFGGTSPNIAYGIHMGDSYSFGSGLGLSFLLSPAPDSSNVDECEKKTTAISEKKDIRKISTNTTVEIVEYSKSFDCFLQQLQITRQTFTYPLTWDIIFSIRAKINMMVTWWLPGLYGLLGACVFLLRDFMRPDPITPFLKSQIIGVLLIVLRVALGGLAGIIIGWFWIPASASGNGAAVNISSIPFGLAFMAGFSIDTLFSLLERIRRMMDADPKNLHKPVQTPLSTRKPQASRRLRAPGFRNWATQGAKHRA